jgi:hypothetical protein
MEAGWLYSPLAQIRWSTVLMAAAILVLVAWRTRRPALAVLTVLAWVGLYELIWDVASLVNGGRQTVGGIIWMAGAIGVAPVFARHLGLRLWLPAYLVCAAAFVAWDLTGFAWNRPGQSGPLLIGPEVLNVLSKDGLALAYLVGGLRLERGQTRAQRGDLGVAVERVRVAAGLEADVAGADAA